MGLRPSLKLLCGITDLQVRDYEIVDSRYTPVSDLPLSEFLEDTPPIPPKDENEEWIDIALGIQDPKASKYNNITQNDYIPKYGYELIEFDPEYGIDSAIGYIVEDSNCYNILYALVSIFPIQSSGLVVLKSRSLEEDYNAKRYLGRWMDERSLNFGQAYNQLRELEQDDNLSYRTNLMLEQAKRIKNKQNYQFFDLTMESYTICAQYLFRWIGLEVSREDMELFLYYKWS